MHRDGARIEVTRDWREGGMECYCVIHTKFQFGTMIKFWKCIVVIVT